MIDEHGKALYRDLNHYERVDLTEVIKGNGPAPSFVLALIEGVPAGSMLSASQHKIPELMGWDRVNALLADLYDAMMFNTRATGNFAKKPPTFPPYPRPQKPVEKKGGITDLYSRMTSGGTNQI